jgi:hypothetical protein
MSSHPRSESKPHPTRDRGFNDLDCLKNADGIIAIISQRRSTGVITIAVMKEFERDGIIERTQFISENLFESYQDMLQRAIDRVRAIRAQGQASAR